MLHNLRSRPRNIKLDRRSGLPDVKLLEDMRQKAMVNAGAVVELPFGDDVQMFNLTVTRDSAHGSWLWMMYKDDGFNSGLVWSHVTHDAEYVCTLISNSNIGFVLNKPSQPLPTSAVALIGEQASNLRKGTLQGNLKKIQIGNLIQSISMTQMTGRLEIIAPTDKAVIYFANGNPVHATIRGAEGVEAMIQLQAWEEGEFTFYDERINVPATINRGLVGLLMEGATFVDHFTYLTKGGLTHESYLVPIAGVDLQQALKNGVDCQEGDVITIYQMIDGTKTWGEIQRDLNFKKSEWVPVMFNLLNSGLICISTTPTKNLSQIASTSKMDWSMLQGFEQNMCRADTGLYAHAALLFFLSQEFYRYEITKHPFSLIVFGYCQKLTKSTEPQFVPFRGRAIQELKEKVFKTKRRYDSLCHYGAFSYAMFLPLTVKQSAIRQAEFLAEMCSTIKISEDYHNTEIEFHANVANFPEDSTSLDELLTIAEKIKSLDC
jgi:hypothetical protein